MRKSTKSLRKKMWKLMSEYVRKRDKYICFTCSAQLTKATSQAGHYIHKDCLDYDEININCQCVRCNKWLSGNLGIYAERLIAKYGEEEVNLLRVKSQQIKKLKKWTISELEEMIDTYKQTLQSMKSIT